MGCFHLMSRHCQRPRWHRVSVVNNYMNTRFFTNFREYIRGKDIWHNRFCLFIWGPGSSFFNQKSVENLVILSLSVIWKIFFVVFGRLYDDLSWAKDEWMTKWRQQSQTVGPMGTFSNIFYVTIVLHQSAKHILFTLYDKQNALKW